MQQFQQGTLFAGRYHVVQCIAAGGMGAVYEVVHAETGRRRALKVMLPHIFESAELRERFQREARIAAQVESEFIVDVSDAGIDAATGMPYMVMELLRGEELGKRLARMGRLPAEEVVTHLRQAALALDKTHQAQIVHRDLKPENLYLTETDEGRTRIKILDFGIAKLVADSSTQANATRSIGTPMYMSPEQFLARPLSGAADIYALGLIAYTFLVGVPYWFAEMNSQQSVIAFGMVAVHGPREPASARAAREGVALPPAFDAWFARATHVDPLRRFPTATGAVAALAEALGMALPRGAMASLSGAEHVPARDSDAGVATVVLQPPSSPAQQTATPTPLSSVRERERPPRGRAGLLAVIIASVLLIGAGLTWYGLTQRDTTPPVSAREPSATSAAPSALPRDLDAPPAAPTSTASAAGPLHTADAETGTLKIGTAIPAATVAPPKPPASSAGARPKPPRPDFEPD